MGSPPGNPEAVVTAFLRDCGAPWRRVSPGEWGLRLEDVAGAPLEVGLRISDGLLRAQAWALPPGRDDMHVLLHRHRLRPLVRYAHSSAGEVHVHGDLPLEAVSAAWLDRLLVAVAEAAELARLAAAPRRQEE